MKKLLFFVLVLFVKTSFSQNSSYSEIKALLRSQGYTIANDLYADLKQGGTTDYYRNFYAGTDYIIVAFSDDADVNDVDIIVYDEDGLEYKRDTDTKAVAVVKLSPLVARQFRVLVKNYQSHTPNYNSRCRFFIAYK